MSKANETEKILILDNVRSAYNVGSIFRIADTVGIPQIILCGVTPTPVDRFNRVNKEIAKTALGAEKTISWRHRAVPSTIVRNLKQQGFTIVAIEEGEGAVDYKRVGVPMPVAFIVGNEVDGISKKILALADVVAAIPMKGKKESLNVAIAAAVALFRILNV